MSKATKKKFPFDMLLEKLSTKNIEHLTTRPFQQGLRQIPPGKVMGEHLSPPICLPCCLVKCLFL